MSDEKIEVTGLGPIVQTWPKARKEAHLSARRLRVEQAELRGLSVRRIAEAVQVDVHTAHDDLKHVRAARSEAFGETMIREERELERARLEDTRSRIVGDMTARPERDGQPAVPAKLTAWQGYRLLLQVSRQKSELLGLNVPQKVHLTEIPAGDPSADGLEEAERPRTLADLLGGDREAAGKLAEVIHMATKRGA